MAAPRKPGATREGKLCKKCGTTTRYVNHGGCVECSRRRSLAYNKTPQRIAYVQDYYSRPEVKARAKTRAGQPEIHLKAIKRNARDRGLEYSLPDELAMKLIQLSCSYCGEKPETTHGLDRRNNDWGYVPGNVIPCCSNCNDLKGDWTADKFLSLVVRIYRHLI